MRLMTDRGDTLVEVIVAFAVFAVVVVGASTIMNKGIAIAEQSLEITQVREQIDSQADLLRYARDEDRDLWSNIKDKATGGAPADTVPTSCPVAASSQIQRSFVLSKTSATGPLAVVSLSDPSKYNDAPSSIAQVDYTTGQSSGLWVETYRIDSNAYDMYIRACWSKFGGADAPATMATVVRLYDQ